MPKLSTQGGSICPVCGHRATPTVELPEYQLFGCDECGCWSSDAAARGAATSFEPTDYFGHADADERKWNALLRRLGPGASRVTSVLDVGCGNGAFLEFIGGRVAPLHREGIELDAGRAQDARARNPAATIHAGDALATLVGLERRFDLITMWDVFEHVAEPGRVLAELGRLVAPRGVVYLQTIHERSLLPLFGRLCHRLSGGRLTYPVRRTHEAHHLVFFTTGGLVRLADAAGLEVRSLWFDRLARTRMDGHPLVTALASLALRVENAAGNGLFLNVILEPRRAPRRDGSHAAGESSRPRVRGAGDRARD